MISTNTRCMGRCTWIAAYATIFGVIFLMLCLTMKSFGPCLFRFLSNGMSILSALAADSLRRMRSATWRPGNLEVLHLGRMATHPHKHMATEQAIPEVAWIPPCTLIIEERWKVLCIHHQFGFIPLKPGDDTMVGGKP